MHIIEKLQDVRRFWRIFGVVRFLLWQVELKSLGRRLREVCWQIVTVEIATETSKIEGLPILLFFKTNQLGSPETMRPKLPVAQVGTEELPLVVPGGKFLCTVVEKVNEMMHGASHVY